MNRRADGLAFGAGLIAFGVVALLAGSIEGFPDVWEMAPAIAAVYLAVRFVAGANPGSRPWLLLAIAVLVLLQVAILADLAIDGSPDLATADHRRRDYRAGPGAAPAHRGN